jgi:hypothetical protein
MLDLLRTDLPIKEREELVEIFKGFDSDNDKGVSFLPLEKLLGLPTYRGSLLRGLISSMGSILAWTAKNAQEIIMRHLKPIKKDRQAMESFVSELLGIGNETRDEFESELFFTALQRMISDGVFSVFEEDPDSSEVFGRMCEFVREVSFLQNIVTPFLGIFSEVKTTFASFSNSNTWCTSRTQI